MCARTKSVLPFRFASFNYHVLSFFPHSKKSETGRCHCFYLKIRTFCYRFAFTFTFFFSFIVCSFLCFFLVWNCKFIYRLFFFHSHAMWEKLYRHRENFACFFSFILITHSSAGGGEGLQECECDSLYVRSFHSCEFGFFHSTFFLFVFLLLHFFYLFGKLTQLTWNRGDMPPSSPLQDHRCWIRVLFFKRLSQHN